MSFKPFNTVISPLHPSLYLSLYLLKILGYLTQSVFGLDFADCTVVGPLHLLPAPLVFSCKLVAGPKALARLMSNPFDKNGGEGALFHSKAMMSCVRLSVMLATHSRDALAP